MTPGYIYVVEQLGQALQEATQLISKLERELVEIRSRVAELEAQADSS